MRVLIKNEYVRDFFATVMFFTRIPIKWSFFSDKAPDLTKAAWAFPLVGFLIGVFSGLLGDHEGVATNEAPVGLYGIHAPKSKCIVSAKRQHVSKITVLVQERIKLLLARTLVLENFVKF